MRPDHAHLSFLTATQTVENLRTMTKQPMTLEDVLTQCEEGNCTAYIRFAGLRGQTSVSGEPGDVPEVVDEAGVQKVLNIESIRTARPGAPISLTMAGPVFRDDDTFEVVTRVWEATVNPPSGDLCFRPSDVLALSDLINGVNPKKSELGAKQKKTAGVLIAVLARMPPIDISAPYAAAETILAAGAAMGLEMPAPNTIVTFLKLAASSTER